MRQSCPVLPVGAADTTIAVAVGVACHYDIL
jgi:hypothetical protein